MEVKKNAFIDALQTEGDFFKRLSSIEHDLNHQLRLNSFLCDNTWVYSKVEEIRIVLIKLFSSDFAYSYWQGTEITASNPQACLSAAQS